MPLFDWSATSSSEIITDHFWIYWATTLPLTLLTMLFIGLWVVFQSRRDEKAAEKAENTIVAGVSDVASLLTDSSSGSVIHRSWFAPTLKKIRTWVSGLRQQIFGSKKRAVDSDVESWDD